MKTFSKWISLSLVLLSLNSCGLPMALARTATNTIKAVGSSAAGLGAAAAAL